MFKKIGIVALGLIAATSSLNYTKLGSYTCTAWKQLKDVASEQVSIDFEIKRLKNEVARLNDDLKQHRTAVANKIASAQELEESVRNLKADLANRKERLERASKELDNGSKRVVYNGREYPVETLTKHLRLDIVAAKRLDKEIQSKEKLLEQRQRAAELAEKQLTSIDEQKRQLLVQIAELENEYEAIQLAQNESKVQFDGSRLAGIKEDMQKLRGRLNRDRIALELAEKQNGTAVVDDKQTSEDVNREIKNFIFGGKAENTVTAEKNKR